MNVSVIVPSFNRRALTSRAVRSVLAQTHPELEILVIDDASRDEEVYEPAPADAPRVRVIRHAVNAGVSSARNTGVKAAAGPLVAFLDSDDYWLPKKLEDQVRVFQEQAETSRLLVYGPYYTIDGSSFTRTPFTPLGKREKLGDYILLRYGCLHVNTWLASRDYLAQFPFDPELKNAEEWDVLLRMEAGGGRFLYCPVAGAVRHVDLRTDRLTTRTHIESRRRFLALNAGHLSPQSHAVLAAVTEEDERPSQSAAAWLLLRVGSFVSAPGMTAPERLSALLHYFAARAVYRIREKLHRQKFEGPDFAASTPAEVPPNTK